MNGKNFENLVMIANAHPAPNSQEYSREEIAQHLQILREIYKDNKALSKELIRALRFAESFISKFEWLDEAEASEIYTILENHEVDL